ncbi:MAG: hypothetical protein WCV72_03275 [Patescibacteria group bacterium]|jgi:hypothetical protein
MVKIHCSDVSHLPSDLVLFSKEGSATQLVARDLILSCFGGGEKFSFNPELDFAQILREAISLAMQVSNDERLTTQQKDFFVRTSDRWNNDFMPLLVPKKPNLK